MAVLVDAHVMPAARRILSAADLEALYAPAAASLRSPPRRAQFFDGLAVFRHAQVREMTVPDHALPLHDIDVTIAGRLSNRLPCQARTCWGLKVVFVLAIALRMVRSLRMQATSATFLSLPLATRRW